MSYSESLNTEELFEDCICDGSPMDYSDDEPKEYTDEDLEHAICEAFKTEKNIHAYSFLCLFRDSDVCPYFYEQRLLLFDDARLYVESIGPKEEHRDYIYNLKEMKLSIYYAPNKNAICLTDTIVLKLDPNDGLTLEVLLGVLRLNKNDYNRPLEAKKDLPKNYWVHDIMEYCYDIRRQMLLEKPQIKKIIAGLYSYDPYLKNYLLAAMDMDEIDSIFDQEKDAISLDMIDKLSKIAGCTKEMAKDTLKIIRTMKPEERVYRWLMSDKEIIMRKSKGLFRLHDYLEDNNLMDEYEADLLDEEDVSDDDPWQELDNKLLSE